jgi:thiamine biosynthesis lipoprotein
MRSAFAALGTVVSLEADRLDAGALIAAQEAVQRIDERYSLYRPDSELARVVAGVLTLPAASDELRDAYAQSHAWSALTDGAFTANRPDGVIDLSGIAKAFAIDDVGAVLGRSGATAWSVTIGGDILLSPGAAVSGHVVGIVDPADRATLIAAVELRAPRRAIATSGRAERGDHIWRLPGLGDDLVQVTVVANTIVEADVLATAIVAGGRELLDRLCDSRDIDVLAVTASGELLATPGIRSALRSPLPVV